MKAGGKKKYRNFTFSVMTKLGAGAGSETDWDKFRIRILIGTSADPRPVLWIRIRRLRNFGS
jgi:hypothetical protein